jgi:hypothetical protein
MIASAVGELFWKRLPYPMVMALIIAFSLSWLCFVAGLIFMYFGKGGILRRKPEPSDPDQKS